MRSVIPIAGAMALLAHFLLASNVVLAAPVEDAEAAHARGEFVTAMSLALPMAEQGNPQAQFLVGLMHTLGQGVPANQREAVKWFRMSAEQANEDAQYLLGKEYSLGAPGVPRDQVEAYFWLVLATESYEKAGRNPERITPLRELLAGRLTPEQRVRVQNRLAAWRAAR